MGLDHFCIASYSEELRFTRQGKYLLLSDGSKNRIKTLAPKQAEKWFKERNHRSSWNKVVKEANNWLKDEKAA